VPLVQQLRDALPDAVRAGDARRRDILRLLIAALDNARIAAGHDLSDEEAVQALQREAKQRRDSIEQFEGGGRSDLVQHEQEELDLIQTYLPAEWSDDELAAAATEVIAEVGAMGPHDMGKVMAPLMKRVGGRADGARVSAVVRAQLAEH
jgi:uncharacterized protein YqeY